MYRILLEGRKAKEGQCKQSNMKETKQKLTWMQRENRFHDGSVA